jgi:N-acyl-D-amino-acid deacylase
LVREGYAADLVLFDPDTVRDEATFENPRQASTGIHYVYVNGTPAIDCGRPTGARAGRALRRGADGRTRVGSTETA